jgi:hypothetical protein
MMNSRQIWKVAMMSVKRMRTVSVPPPATRDQPDRHPMARTTSWATRATVSENERHPPFCQQVVTEGIGPQQVTR